MADEKKDKVVILGRVGHPEYMSEWEYFDFFERKKIVERIWPKNSEELKDFYQMLEKLDFNVQNSLQDGRKVLTAVRFYKGTEIIYDRYWQLSETVSISALSTKIVSFKKIVIMEKSIEIKRVNAINEYANASDEGKELLERLFGKDFLTMPDVRERIKTFEDAVKEIGEDNNLVTLYESYKKDLPQHEAEDDDVLAYMQLRIVCAALNEGWKPTFKPGEYRYTPYYWLYTQEEVDRMSKEEKSRMIPLPAGVGDASGGSYLGVSVMGSNSVVSGSNTYFGGALTLRSAEIARYAGSAFPELWLRFQMYPVFKK